MNNIINPIVDDNLLQISDENSNICSLSPDSEQCTCDIPEPPFNIKLRPSINFYKGTSFRMCGDGMPGASYINDEYFIDCVFHNGKTGVCLKSHFSSEEPTYNSVYGQLMLKETSPGIHVGPNPPSESVYGKFAEHMLGLDTDEVNQSMSVYSKAEVDEKLKPTVMSISEYEALENKEDKLYFLYEG